MISSVLIFQDEDYDSIDSPHPPLPVDPRVVTQYNHVGEQEEAFLSIPFVHKFPALRSKKFIEEYT